MSELVLSAAQRRRSIAVVIATISVAAMTLGLTWPLLALILKSQGVSTGLIGLSSACQTLAVLVVLPAAPWIMVRVRTVPLILASVAAIVAMLVLLPAFPDVYAWFPIRFVLGGAIEFLFIACDVWINQVAEEKTRGRVIGIYGLVMSAGFAVGPLVINVTGIEGWLPFLIGIGFLLLATLPLSLSRGVVPQIEGHPSGRILYFLLIAPTLMIAGMMYGFVDSAALSFLPIYGLGFGYDQSTVVTMVTVIIIGSVVAQLPVGWLADHVGGRVMIIGATTATLISGGLLPFVIEQPVLLWPTLLVLGGALGAFYTIGMVMIGRRFRGADLVAVNAVFVLMWGIGAVGGPAITGAAMDAFGLNAMPAVVVIACLLYLPLAILRLIKGGRE